MILFVFVQEKNLMDSLVKIYVYVSLIWYGFCWVWFTQREKKGIRERENKGKKRNQREEREKRGLTNDINNVE